MNKKVTYEEKLGKLQIELVNLQQWVEKTGQKIVIIFEGRDSAGKGGIIKTITSRLNPRVVKVAALGKPTEKERGQWYFQRYVNYLPSAGEIVLFDRSWYNRAGVENVMGFCSEDEYQLFLDNCPVFEKMLVDSGITLIKYWLSISQGTQEKRFKDRLTSPLKRWKFSDMDRISREKWIEYTQAKNAMFRHTDTQKCPWYCVDANHKKTARINCISHLLSVINYKTIQHDDIRLTPIKLHAERKHDNPNLKWVPDVLGDENN